MYEESSDAGKYIVIGLLLVGIFLGLILLPLGLSKAQTSQTNATTSKPASFSDSISASTLCSAGLGCEGSQTQSGQSSGSLLGGIFGGGNRGPNFDPIISVVNVEGQSAVYRIIDGKKHSIPTTEIFYSYGFDVNIVEKISQKELDNYPLAKLFIVEGDENKNPTIYYLTEGGMLRPMLNDRVFYSYGNQKEYNYYPRNQFIFIERPKLDRDIYQISGGIKRYLTPVAVKRMGLKENEIAPVNQFEFDEYPEGEPVIF